MREIESKAVTQAVRQLCIDANCHLGEDVKECIRCSRREETWPVAQGILDNLVKTMKSPRNMRSPSARIPAWPASLWKSARKCMWPAIWRRPSMRGVRQGYHDGCLRCSVVGDPLRRVNTKDNTPAMIYYDIVPGDGLKITVAPKGFGSENMSQIKMLRPSDGLEGVKEFVLQAVREAGPNPCPPIVVGVGIGGTFDKAATIAKRALIRPLDSYNPDPYYEELERELLEKINRMGIGPQGFGGKTTALKVNVEALPTHIAGLPCAVNINCHVTRHKEAVL